MPTTFCLYVRIACWVRVANIYLYYFAILMTMAGVLFLFYKLSSQKYAQNLTTVVPYCVVWCGLYAHNHRVD